LGIGYIYKTEEITSLDNLTPLFSDDSYAFTRPAVLTTATHVSGQELKLINIHLKCCDDGNSIDRRLQASVKLKNYIDQNLSNVSVIVLGDYNEDLTQPEGNNVLTNFISDAADYRFVDMSIAEGSSAFWSYPSWPSHLDHILITNELFDQVYVTKTIRFSYCEGSYFDNVSDHYPVMLRLTTVD
jgi:endonuclease/exonuclease/phosphatase family metal-dependent hydrolase